MWHAATQTLQAQGKVAVVAIVQDQHPDRARLFLQWKQVDWPVLADSLDLLNLETVPLTVAVDEYGIVRFSALPMSAATTIGQTFVDQTYAPPTTPLPPFEKPNLGVLRAATASNTAGAWRAYADAAVVWGGQSRTNDAIDAYRRAAQIDPDDGATRFRLGSALRQRYDSPSRRATDFQEAEEHWAKALDLHPNRYIWRRRVQQYGPHLATPYPFFDWIRDARAEIVQRGEKPLALAVEPGDSEYATAGTSAAALKAPAAEPDARGRIQRDRGEFVSVETVIVPPIVVAGETARVHLTFRPNVTTKAHWNNEVVPLVFWVNPPQGWTVNRRATAVPSASAAVSQEPRALEFELAAAPGQRAGTITVPGYALYYVCEDVNGVCMYRRRDVDLALRVVAAPERREP